ncbi:MAG TPA: phosphatidylinositol-specific phospholipase C/glycerophosphodiester phosphodiesterase family protein [Puia sp.]|nr:phosphatidylinositol-specific phospholipase C/glycerophosphodiester phosphodiesterase family protein [Puia sp.]
MKKWLWLFALPFFLCCSAPGPHYTLANTHSHNDYEQPIPFRTAYNAQFGSIEADVFLVDGRLMVAHDRKELALDRTLEEYYVKPLSARVAMNHGHPYADSTRRLQMLIDVKADSTAVLDALIGLLAKYPNLTSTPFLTWVISGNRPDPSLYATYPSYIAFDGILLHHYPPAALSRIVMMSDDLHDYTRWNGAGNIPAADRRRILAAIAWSHALHLPVRFWDAPDFPHAWQQLMQLRVDFINTDHIQQLAEYIRTR